tara:strand:- start:809 stop:1789 length:981 start_codon:yes stop_codon:yes gene_type:complete
MKVAFLTEMGFEGVIPNTHPNARTEFAWMNALDAIHYPLQNYKSVSDYDVVFIIFPKGKLFLSAEGSKITDGLNPASNYLQEPIVDILKSVNKKVYYIQEGPHWWWNDYEIIDQIQFYNFLAKTDGIFAHNESDVNYYSGLLPTKKVEVIPTLMIENLIRGISSKPEDKVLIGGNFARWYGGFESYMVATEFDVPIWAQESHAKRNNEGAMEDLHHFDRMVWIDWMKEVSKFKYAVHLMPTVAAGTFSLNCAYFGIPVIGNIKVDTQKTLHPMTSVDVSNVKGARELAKKLKENDEFYNQCSKLARQQYESYYTKKTWLTEMNKKI